MIKLIKYGTTNTYLIRGERGSLLFDTGWAGTLPAFWQNIFRRFGRIYQTFSAAFNIIFIDVYLLTVIVVIFVVRRHLHTKEKS